MQEEGTMYLITRCVKSNYGGGSMDVSSRKTMQRKNVKKSILPTVTKIYLLHTAISEGSMYENIIKIHMLSTVERQQQQENSVGPGQQITIQHCCNPLSHITYCSPFSQYLKDSTCFCSAFKFFW